MPKFFVEVSNGNQLLNLVEDVEAYDAEKAANIVRNAYPEHWQQVFSFKAWPIMAVGKKKHK